ncbi:hypothetical protein C7212DRAFT_46731, partial [Tuber magnatum]
SNQNLIFDIWSIKPVKKIRIPVLFINYNNYIGGVQIPDQQTGYYYLPFFFWLLETAIINSYLLPQVYL